jgi:hypothetical protein
MRDVRDWIGRRQIKKRWDVRTAVQFTRTARACVYRFSARTCRFVQYRQSTHRSKFVTGSRPVYRDRHSRAGIGKSDTAAFFRSIRYCSQKQGWMSALACTRQLRSALVNTSRIQDRIRPDDCGSPLHTDSGPNIYVFREFL